MKQRVLGALVLAGCALAGTGISAYVVQASDHDDGPQGTQQKNLGLTDLYVFREQDQNANVKDDNVIFIMNSNPRSEGGKQYHYATNARYEFHVSRAANNAAAPTTKDDIVMRFEFGDVHEASQKQALRLTVIKDGQITGVDKTADGKAIVTTPRGMDPINNRVMVGNQEVTVFAGLREDPFFLDVDQFFRVRASAAARAGGDKQDQVTFRNPGVDFTAGLNVLSIVARVPASMLKGPNGNPTFDVWETISVKK